ncbi:hypothetical protein L873DRAFT_1460033 [Choiromyces venosus 120613-1]|uniref:Uncharacterized protein n=1 Tax=Choiromyces venosus 120613-1 TaxID=1336337 RepID=A0A3N4KEC7_9PEZI|nr:hypothetical protein L873DRAFT_1460033 [Choiromyces venosus 120613-1]
MATELDPHHLVALMHFQFQGEQARASRRLDPTSHSLKYGIRDDHGTNVRTFPVLDALASIFVSQESSQVVAIALQLNSQKQEIRLTIAENQEVRPGQVNHLTKVWEKLQTLSGEYAKQRGSRWDKHEGMSPEIPWDVAFSLRAEIYSDIYQYSLKKQMKRITKWKDGLRLFLVHLLEHRGGANLEGFELNLFNAALGLRATLKLIGKLHDNPQNQLTDDQWKTIYEQNTWVTENVRLVFVDGGRMGCESLVNELEEYYPRSQFELRRALEKLTSLDRHIEALFAFAHSPRLRHALQYRMSISVVPEQTRTVKLPTSQEQWQSILEAACNERRVWQKKDSALLSEMFQLEYTCPVHCECRLIQYLMAKHNTPWDNVPPFNYIGVSKLSCGACHIWMEAFNGLDGRQFYTRGSHGKWYWPWGVPTVGGESLGKIMAEKISVEYKAYQRGLGRVRLDSDSSDAEPLRVRPRMGAAVADRVASSAAEAVLEDGGSGLDLMKTPY